MMVLHDEREEKDLLVVCGYERGIPAPIRLLVVRAPGESWFDNHDRGNVSIM